MNSYRTTGVVLYEAPVTKPCPRCGVSFTTTSRIQKRCNICRKIVEIEQWQRALLRRAERRQAARSALVK